MAKDKTNRDTGREAEAREALADPRLDGVLRAEGGSVPAWARLLVSLIVATVPREVVELVLGGNEDKSPNWNTPVGGGYVLRHFNAKSRQQLQREDIPAEVMDRAERELGRFGIRIEDDPVELERQAQQAFEKEQQARTIREQLERARSRPQQAAAVTPVETPTTAVETGGGVPVRSLSNGMTSIAGFPVAELAGRPREDLIRIDGISPTVADELTAMEPTTPAAQ